MRFDGRVPCRQQSTASCKPTVLVNLTSEEEQAAREKVSNFLTTAKTDDENKLAVEGLRYLRESKVS